MGRQHFCIILKNRICTVLMQLPCVRLLAALYLPRLFRHCTPRLAACWPARDVSFPFGYFSPPTGVLQSLRIQGSHLSENFGLPSFRIAFCLSSNLSEFNYWGGSNFSDFSCFLNGLFLPLNACYAAKPNRDERTEE